ncbi:MAG: lysophospholipid acyltransferase family protein [Cyclonatronaceae bacterium]
MSDSNRQEPTFKLDFRPGNLWARTALRVFRKPLEQVLDFKTLNAIHKKAKAWPGDAPFSTKLIESMGITLDIDPRQLARIPAEGRLVVVANHPFGGIEGVILASVLQKVRPDVKIMANYMLEIIPELRDVFLFVNPFETKEAARQNLASMKGTLGHLKNEGVLGVFPAGTVSHLSWGDRQIKDPEWKTNIAGIIRRTQAPVLPVYFCGHNGPLFQAAGLLHPRLRTALLPRQFSNKRKRHLRLQIGHPIPAKRLQAFPDAPTLMSYLRQRTYLLPGISADSAPKPEPKPASFPMQEAIIEAVDKELLLHDINAFSEAQKLVENNEYDVFYAEHHQIPNVMREIGRLREVSFRATDEGTGKSIDLDAFDTYYLHLFVWHRNNKDIVGAYRLGHTDKILERKDRQGLYITTLFGIQPGLLEQITPALEMGRSFVAPKYQRSFAPLLMLWKGIGAYVVRHPQYRILFGPVSISNDYETKSRNLLVRFLQASNYLPELAQKVEPKTPFKPENTADFDAAGELGNVMNINDISEMISTIESDSKGVPILLKQYLKLGGKLLGFNVDPEFSNALDGLILVDLTETPKKILTRYMGNEGAEAFLRYHSDTNTAANPGGKTGNAS